MNRDDETVMELEMREALEDSNPAEGTQARNAPSETVPRAAAGPSAYTGTLVGLSDSGWPEVDFPENPSDRPVPARTTVELHGTNVGGRVVLAFEGGDLRKPIILGCVRSTLQPSPVAAVASAGPVEAKVDGETITLTADKEIVLRCGKASITLTRAGKVIIRGAYLLSRSSGVNRIKGGSIQMN